MELLGVMATVRSISVVRDTWLLDFIAKSQNFFVGICERLVFLLAINVLMIQKFLVIFDQARPLQGASGSISSRCGPNVGRCLDATLS